MSFIDDDRHTFVVRIWREPRELRDAERPWRGMIEHVPSGERRPLTRTIDVVEFIEEQLAVTAHRQLWQRTVQALHDWQESEAAEDTGDPSDQ